MDLCEAIQTAVDRHPEEAAQRSCVSSILSSMGHVLAPRSTPATLDGTPVRVHTWEGTLVGDIVLVRGRVCLAAHLVREANGSIRLLDKLALDRKALSRTLGAPGWSKGGKVTASRLTPEQRKARAQRAAITRWWKRDQKQNELALSSKHKRKKTTS